MKQNLYGKYPGVLKYDVKYVKSCSEMELFILVSKYYEVIHATTYYEKMISFYQKLNDEKMVDYFKEKIRIEKEKCPLLTENPQEFYYTLNYCLLQTARFNTNIAYNPNGEVIITEEFNEWYNNWQLYVNTMDESPLAIYRKCRYEGKSLEYFNNDGSTSASIIENKYWENVENINIKNSKPVLQKNIRQIYA